MSRPRLLTPFLNLGHAFDHLLMLTFPTVVLAMAPEFGWRYGDMLKLSLGGFIAFGAGSLPAGWLGDRWSRRGMMIVFFVGIGGAAVITGLAQTPTEIAIGLTLIGTFAAIYHPVGLAMLVRDQAQLGRTLGINGVFGNLGVAFAALTAGGFAEFVGWRAAFIVPGAVAVAAGIAFAALVEVDNDGGRRAATPRAHLDNRTVTQIFAVLLVATSCGGIIFNATTIAMPKLFDERLRALTHSTFAVGALVCAVYVIAALAQYCVGQLIDRVSIKSVLVPVAALQVPLLWLAAHMTGTAMLVVAVLMMFFVFGQIPINDAMVARCTDERWRSRVYAVRYVVSFGASTLAVPLISVLHGDGAGFAAVFVALAALAVGTTMAALCFPQRRLDTAQATSVSSYAGD